MKECYSEDVYSWTQFAAIISEQKGRWAYRGQRNDWPLKTSLERVLVNWGIDLSEGPMIEKTIIRDFRRQYRGHDQSLVKTDTLYCLALMQHHGAPTRLLDCTYSPFVAAKFAIEAGGKDAVIWCFDRRWCYEGVRKVIDDSLIRDRDTDGLRNDSTFLPLYCDGENRQKFVFLENPFDLNEHLIIQQGVFLCPGDISTCFVANIQAMDGFELKENVVKLRLKMDTDQAYEFASMLKSMNINSAALFPGLDGFANSLGESIFLYRTLAQKRIGQMDHERP